MLPRAVTWHIFVYLNPWVLSAHVTIDMSMREREIEWERKRLRKQRFLSPWCHNFNVNFHKINCILFSNFIVYCILFLLFYRFQYSVVPWRFLLSTRFQEYINGLLETFRFAWISSCNKKGSLFHIFRVQHIPWNPCLNKGFIRIALWEGRFSLRDKSLHQFHCELYVLSNTVLFQL